MIRKKALKQQVDLLTFQLLDQKREWDEKKQQLIASYNAKVQDFAAETRRYSDLHSRVSKVLTVFKESAFNQFYREVIVSELEQVLDPNASNQLDPGKIRIGKEQVYKPKHDRI